MSYHTASKFIEKMGYMFMTPHDQIRQAHTPEDAEEIIKLLTEEKPRTITVNGYFGEKEVTKEEFAQEWIDHIRQLKRISYSLDWMDYVTSVEKKTELECDAEFDRMWEKQNNDK